MACSPRQRIMAWVVLWRRFHCLRRRPRNGMRTCPPAPWYALSAQHLSPAAARASMIPCSRAAVRSWAEPGRAGEAQRSPSERIGEDLNIHAVAFVFPGVVRGVGGDAVDGQQGAVEDDERLGPYGLHRLGQGRGEGGQNLDGFTYVAVDGGDPDAEPRCELGVGVTAPQVGQGEQGLTCHGKPPPPRPDVPAPGPQFSGQEPQGAGGQVDRGRIDKHAKLLANTGDLGRESIYQELRRCARQSETFSAASSEEAHRQGRLAAEAAC